VSFVFILAWWANHDHIQASNFVSDDGSKLTIHSGFDMELQNADQHQTATGIKGSEKLTSETFFG